MHLDDVDDEVDLSTTSRADRVPAPRRLATVTIAALAMSVLGWSVLGPGAGVAGHLHGSAAEAAAGLQPGAVGPMTRTYYIAADPVAWNYAPNGSDQITGAPWDAKASIYTVAGPGRIGSTYTKSVYREYTDATFTTLKPRAAADAYLGILGPVIRAQVGDTLRLVFRNNTSFSASIHVHNLRFTKANEGAPYNDGTTGADKLDDAVAPGTTYTYSFPVETRAGPGPGDGSSVLTMYHSHTLETADTYSGLIGPMVIAKQGWGKADGSPVDTDQEVFSLFQVWDENTSLWLDQNMASMAPDPLLTNTQLKLDPDFIESNLMHAINGYVYGNGPIPVLKLNKRARWYLWSMGTERDLHTPHVHGNVWTSSMGMKMDMTGVLPGEMVTMNMVPDNLGIWLYHCHVNDHLDAGMVTRYQVTV